MEKYNFQGQMIVLSDTQKDHLKMLLKDGVTNLHDTGSFYRRPVLEGLKQYGLVESTMSVEPTSRAYLKTEYVLTREGKEFALLQCASSIAEFWGFLFKLLKVVDRLEAPMPGIPVFMRELPVMAFLSQFVDESDWHLISDVEYDQADCRFRVYFISGVMVYPSFPDGHYEIGIIDPIGAIHYNHHPDMTNPSYINTANAMSSGDAALMGNCLIAAAKVVDCLNQLLC